MTAHVGWAGFICPTIDPRRTMLGKQTLPNLDFLTAAALKYKSIKPTLVIPTESRRQGKIHLPNN